MKLSDVIVLDQKFARSINLERDSSEMAVLNNYQVTAKAQEVIERFVAALGDEKVSAWSLVGPYGMGKSAFLHFLLCTTGSNTCSLTQTALDKLKSANEDLYDRFTGRKNQVTSQTGFFRIPIVASFESIDSTLARGLYQAVLQSDLSNKDAICNEMDKQIESNSTKSTNLINMFEKVAEAAKTPLVIIIDELGKNLEYLSYHYHDGDLFILQQLAEMENVYLWVSLHQAFQEYMSGFSVVQQQEWNKVQGRFEEISFVESAPQMLQFIDTVVGHKFTEDLYRQVEEWANGIKKSLESIDVIGKDYFDVDTISNLYPLHPITSLALVELCRKYAQNERTLVSFLCSGHVFALPAKMEKIVIGDNEQLPAIGLDSLYDYFFRLCNTSLASRPEAQRWLEIHDIIQSAAQFTEEETVLLRNIGVLNLLAGSLRLKASLEMISSVMKYAHLWPSNKTNEIMNSLVKRGAIFNRKYSGEFRLWEGSDFDVNGAIAKEKSKLSLRSLEEILEKHLPLSPIMAARHSLEKGTMRKFERRWIDHESLLDKQLAPYPGLDGLLIYCYGTAKEPVKVPKVCSDGRPLMLAYAPAKETLSEIALEFVACQYVLDKYPQMSHDKVARKEVKFRYEVSRERFRKYLEKAFTPGTTGLIWYAEEEKCLICNRRELSSKISDLCDKYYKDAPEIRNEIVSGEKLSSTAVGARRELVEAMATRAHQKDLGFTGWGPEVAMYQSLLLAKDVHKPNPDTGSWYLTLEGNERELSEVWKTLDQMLEEADDSGKTVEDMINELRKPPFGLRQGPSLICISLYLLVESENLIVFCENAYHPYLTAADMALLLKRPDLFTVKTFVTDDIQQRVFSTYKGVVEKAQIKVDSGLRNATMLGVVGPLMKFIDELPRYSKQTRSISKKAQQTRAVITNAVDPLHFLFEELPEALGISTGRANIDSWSQELESSLQLALAELSVAFEKLNQGIQETLLQKFHSPDLEQLYATQNPKANSLLKICDATDLKPVLQAMARNESDLENWVQGIAGAVLKKPVDAWRDDDFEVFRVGLADYADRIDQLKALVETDSAEGNVHVISVMEPSGSVKREVMCVDGSDSEVQDALNQILKLSPSKARAVLALLARNIIWGGFDSE
jgi:hypothetical protein